MERIEEFLKERAQQGLLRTLRPVSSRSQGKIWQGEKEYIDFSSNDYLGLSSHPRLIEESKKAIDEFGTSSSASRLMSGDLRMHHQLEEEVSRFKNKESALVFNSGYQANVSIISSLYGRGDCIFSDRLNHASIVDGILLSRAKVFRFRHNDLEQLETLLKKERNKSNKALIITESIFSMDGDRAPLKALVDLKEEYDCSMMVDEAHATGIFGRGGAGLVQEEGLEDRVDLIMGTFSKALAGFGAYLACSQKIADYLINTCRGFIYSTALPPAVIASNLASIRIVKEETFRRERVLASASYFRDALKKKGFLIKGESQIVPVVIGENVKALELSSMLQERGYYVLAVRPPTVPAGEARLRFSLNFHHDNVILRRLIDDIGALRI